MIQKTSSLRKTKTDDSNETFAKSASCTTTRTSNPSRIDEDKTAVKNSKTESLASLEEQPFTVENFRILVAKLSINGAKTQKYPSLEALLLMENL